MSVGTEAVRFGNCYTFALAQRRRVGGWLVLRRSVKSWVPHMQWAPAGVERGAVPMSSWLAGFRKIMGPERGYLIWSDAGVYWRPRLHALQIVEYLPPPWVDRWISRYRIARWVPLHAVVFFGWTRHGQGEESRTQNLIDRTWPGGRVESDAADR